MARVFGVVSAETATSLRDGLFREVREGRGGLAVDLSDVDYLDGAGAAVLLEVDRALRSAGRILEIRGASGVAAGVLSLVDWASLAQLPVPAPSRHPGIALQVGEAALELRREAGQLCAFAGGLTLCAARCMLTRNFRWGEVFRWVETSGVDAAPIVALVSTLMGLIMAFLGALQLKPYGADLYVADLVALAMVRELGPIMTGILVAGRSGSGFAAEIGSMGANDEVDALVVMGLDPVTHLAVPRVAAVVLAMPSLALLSTVAGVLGGLAVGVFQLDLTVGQYLVETRDILGVRHIAVGLGKAVVFGLLVSAVGCYKGLGAEKTADGVGRAATSSVVAGILLIILADALFAIVLAYLPF